MLSVVRPSVRCQYTDSVNNTAGADGSIGADGISDVEAPEYFCEILSSAALLNC